MREGTKLNVKKLYIGLILVLSVVVIYLMALLVQDRGIAEGKVSSDKLVRPDEWTFIISADMQNNVPQLMVDGKSVKLTEGIYIDDDLNIFLPGSILSDTFKCAVNDIGDNYIELQKGETVVKVYGTGNYIEVSGDVKVVEKPIIERYGSIYINYKVMELGLSYESKWQPSSNTLSMVDDNATESILPSRYSYREVGRLPDIENQGIYGTCWAFASMGALESAILPYESYDFSEENMSQNGGYKGTQLDGGDYTRAIAYLTSWAGPILEEDDEYGDGIVNTEATAVKHVQEVELLESKNLEAIKKAVFLNGGVETCLYTSMTSAGEKSMYYNDETYAYCYIGTKSPNHDVVIVGWDDNYPKENFNSKLEANGAFICMNSWGEDFGDDGLFYVSYYDSNIGMHNAVYTRIDDADNYDNIYQTDICGWIGQLGYEEESAYFANVYTANSDELLRAVGFYTTGKDTSYEIYYVDGFVNEDSFDKKILVQSGKIANSGYHTVDLDKAVGLVEGQKYAVVVKIKTPGETKPIAIEYRANYATRNVDISDGEGYISYNGRSWEHVEETKECNICLKMYTDNHG
jgi:C1A family cysteine protease